jgi:mannose-6-phosphate isomerase
MILEKDWGLIKEYTLNQVCTVKLLALAPGMHTSLHHHRLRDDMWIILDDGLEVQVGEERSFPREGDEFVIGAGTPHAIFAHDTAGRVLEIDFGFTTEDDTLLEEGAARGGD